jgi:single-stranded-DNA-specific exonuclease
MAEGWRVRPTDEAGAQGLAACLGVRGLTARVLAARGYLTAEAARHFLSPRLADLRPPEGMADLEAAVDRIVRAVRSGEKVAVFGDYDVDGLTTAGILALMLRALGIEVEARMAKRATGYGFSPADAAALGAQGCSLVLTGDCGTSDHESIELCRRRAVDVIVIDHHHVPIGEAGALALLNSHRQDDRFCFKGLASCGVAFYLAAAVRTRLRSLGDARGGALDPRAWLDLVALGTVADLVPLTDENRILVAAGLRELSARRRPGLAALAEVAGLAADEIGTTDVSFRLAPRLNAAGRLGDSQLALDLLLATDRRAADRLAAELDELNRKRQAIQEKIWAEAVAAAEEFAGEPALVLGAEGWHQGVVGVVAAKLTEKYRRPSVVVGFSRGRGKGSARTLGGFDLYQALAACGEYLTAFGGHPAAAGVSLDEPNLASFRAAFVAAARSHFASAPQSDCIEVDAVARLSDIDLVQAEELGRLAPFGRANAEPLIAIPGARVRRTRVVGTSHLQLVLEDGSAVTDAIAFGMADRDPGQGASLDVVGNAEVDQFRGQRRIRLRVRHLLRSLS